MTSLVFDLLVYALVGAALTLGVRGLGFALRIVPTSRAGRELAERAWPLAVAAIVLAYVLGGVGLLFSRGSEREALAAALVLLVLIGLSWGVLRDVVAGVYLRSGRACRVGDTIRVGDVEGRVDQLSWRAMIVVTPSDSQAVLPYARVLSAPIHRAPQRAEVYPHAFELEVPDGRRTAVLKAQVRQAALLSHWVSVVRDPVVELTGESKLGVTVFAIAPERGYEIEAAVRRATGITERRTSPDA